MNKTTKDVPNNNFSKAAEETIDEIQKVLGETEKNIEKKLVPIRKTVLRRFPVIFLLLVTFGVTATLTGMEQLLIQQAFLHEHPFIIFVAGIITLVFTGTLYKKLG